MSKHAKDSNASFHPLSAPDFLPLPQLRDLQLQRLQTIVDRAYNLVKLFHKRMKERGLTPADVKKLDDITLLPFAEKTDLRDTYPFGLFASPMKDIVRLHASSGTTGKPIVVAYTQADVQVWTNVMVRSFAACGLHEGDIILGIKGQAVSGQADFYKKLWATGEAGVEIALDVVQGIEVKKVSVKSIDRDRYFRPRPIY